MNISCFAYRDINRNGIYDLGDRPYAGLKFQLDRPGDTALQFTSNIGGFANFKMSLNNKTYPIFLPGQYQILAEPPAEWQITSNNASQNLNIRELKGSPAGLIAEPTLKPIGVAPELKIYGQIDLEQWGSSEQILITATRQGEKALEITLNEEGVFSFPAATGLWDIKFADQSGIRHQRQVKLTDYAIRLSGIIPGPPPVARQTALQFIDFDDLTYSDTLFEIPNGYGGLNWYNWISTHQKLYRGNGYINATTSGEYLAYNSSGHPATISSKTPFDLEQVNIGVAWPDAEKGDITITAWRDDQIAYRDVLRASSAGPIIFAANYLGITRIEFHTEHYWQVVLDDLVYRP